MNEILQNLSIVKGRIAGACEKAGRSPHEVKLLLATKTVSTEKIKIALEAGETLVGENKVQELKKSLIPLKTFHTKPISLATCKRIKSKTY